MTAVSSLAFEFYAVAGRDRTMRQFLEQNFSDYEVALARVVQRGVEAGEFRAVDADQIALTVLEGLNLLNLAEAGEPPRARRCRQTPSLDACPARRWRRP